MNLNSGAERADETQQDLTAGGLWPRVSRIPAVDSILRPDTHPYLGLDLAERYKDLPLQMLEISTFLRNRPRIDDRTIGGMGSWRQRLEDPLDFMKPN